MYNTNIQSQIEELETLQSIFMEDMLLESEIIDLDKNQNLPFQFKLIVPIETSPETIFVRLLANDNNQEGIIPVNQSFPPCTLSISLPPTYPDPDPPEIQINASWITQNIQQQLLNQINEIIEIEQGVSVIFPICTWLQYDCIEYLCNNVDNNKKNENNEKSFTLYYETMSKSNLSTTQNFYSTSMEEIVESLLNHKKEQNWLIFLNENHICDLCFDEKEGSQFEIFPCCEKGFCYDCVVEMITLLTKNGSVELLKCPNCEESFHPNFIKKFVCDEVYERFDRLLLQRTLNSMNDVQYCPRCETVTIISDDLGRCTSFAFCSKCRDSYHQGRKCDEWAIYLKGIKDKKDYDEELKTIKQLRKDSKRCPNCQYFVSRLSGCNKMTCSVCGSFFCFQCGLGITGYEHFNTKGSTCDLFPNESTVSIPENRRRPPTVEPGVIKSEDYKFCPTCRQKNFKYNRNNDVKCWSCTSHFCFLCSKSIKGTLHFVSSGCIQHSE